MAKAIHSMVRVLDEARSVDFHGRAFGLRVAERLDLETFTLIYLSNPETEFELEPTINKDRERPCDPGDGYGHPAVPVADLAAEHARFAAEGLNPRNLVEFAPDGKLVGRFFIKADPDGYEIKVLERAGRFT